MFRRVALTVALAAAAVAGGGCGKSAPAKQQVVPGAKAGVVLEVGGAVTATRPGAAPRALAKGDAVSGDDVIQTGADGSVLIELDHNHVTFTLPAGKQQQVSTSLAWSQPVAAARPTTTDEHSAAAGRAIERSAVDTAASSADEVPERAIAEPEAPDQQIEKPEQKDKHVKAPDPAEPPENAKPDPGPMLDIKSGGGGGGGGGAAGGESDDDAMTETQPLGASDGEREVGRGAPRVPPKRYDASTTVTGALTRNELAGVLDPNKIAQCLEAHEVTVTIVVTAAGKAGRVTTSADKATTTCVRAVAGAIAFPARDAETTIKLVLTRAGE